MCRPRPSLFIVPMAILNRPKGSEISPGVLWDCSDAVKLVSVGEARGGGDTETRVGSCIVGAPEGEAVYSHREDEESWGI